GVLQSNLHRKVGDDSLYGIGLTRHLARFPVVRGVATTRGKYASLNLRLSGIHSAQASASKMACVVHPRRFCVASVPQIQRGTPQHPSSGELSFDLEPLPSELETDG